LNFIYHVAIFSNWENQLQFQEYNLHANQSWNVKVMNYFDFSSIKFIFLVIHEELLDASMWLKLPTG
jgi:hypothetical protein